MLSGNPAYVLDCIDDVTTKAELLALCFKMGIPVISSMGAALKSDPTRILMGTLRDAVRDPLATKIKWKLKKYMGLSEEDMEHIKCVFSSESLVSSLLPLTEEQQEAPGGWYPTRRSLSPES
jgi:tRNA A37 threonylcarbamoyladenosine dehydratase